MEKQYVYQAEPAVRDRRKKKKRMSFCARLAAGILLILVGALLQKGCDMIGNALSTDEAVLPNTGSAAAETVPAALRTSHPDQEFLTLVNQWHPISGGAEPNLAEVENGYQFDARAADKLKEMLADARKDGLAPIICSAYRSGEYQTKLYKKQVDKQMATGLSRADAEEKAKTVVAYPGTSEHQLGLAADIVATSYQMLDDQQAETKEAKWLKENCAKYGFILRYPQAKSDMTGVIFEPWHYRYVGETAAKEIMKRGICLEEYLEK